MSHKRVGRILKRVTLTFDNGPEPGVTPHVLDTLRRHSVKATFFVLGKKVVTPEGLGLAQRARDEGHRIGNHTYTHSKRLGELDRARALDEIERTEKALEWLDQRPRLFRPIGGGELTKSLLHPAVVERLMERGYTCVLWNSIPGDWRAPQGWLERAMIDCHLREWSLVVLHDHLHNGAMDQLDEFITRLRADSFEIVQDFPPDCTPIVEGKMVGSVEKYVTG